MANDGKLYIIISDRPDAGGTGTLDLETGEVTDVKKKSGWNYASHRFASFVESQAKGFVNYGINNIGNFTGDYITQRKANETIQALSIATNVIMSTVAGAKFGVPGAIAGFAIAVGSTAINFAQQGYTQLMENRKLNYNIEQLRRRSGLNSKLDDSRGTEN